MVGRSQGVAPALQEDVQELGCSCAFGDEWCGSDGVGVVGLGVGCSCCFFVSLLSLVLKRQRLMKMFCRLGPVVLATQSVLLVSASTTFQAPFALSVATSVR